MNWGRTELEVEINKNGGWGKDCMTDARGFFVQFLPACLLYDQRLAFEQIYSIQERGESNRDCRKNSCFSGDFYNFTINRMAPVLNGTGHIPEILVRRIYSILYLMHPGSA